MLAAGERVLGFSQIGITGPVPISETVAFFGGRNHTNHLSPGDMPVQGQAFRGTWAAWRKGGFLNKEQVIGSKRREMAYQRKPMQRAGLSFFSELNQQQRLRA